jgi:hypothetical protein
MSAPLPTPSVPVDAARIAQAHQLYCQLTGQNLSLRFDRERMWFELLRLGHSLDEVRAVITYLQREIRAQRRNVGALKLSNLLQPDRFEEDLQISRVRLRPPAPPTPVRPSVTTLTMPEADRERGRQRAVQFLREIRSALR